MVALQNVILKAHALFLVALLALSISCAPAIAPLEQNSSMIIGKVVVNNQYAGGYYGHLPIGVLDKGLAVEIESLDGKQNQSVTTEEQGYFFVPNIAPNTYHVLRVTIDSGPGTRIRGREKHGLTIRRPLFTPVPGKATYIGSLTIEVSREGFTKVRETWENERAEAYFQQSHAGSLWASREFVGVGPKPAQVAQGTASPEVPTKPAIQAPLKIERPEWKVGYEWRYAWKRPGSSGTFTREIVREDSFEGIASYVMRIGKNEYFLAKDSLGDFATMSGGKITFKRSPPLLSISWPIEVGKEWRNTFLLERIEERSSQTYDYRAVVSKVEEVQVPAGTFEAFKIEKYDFYTRNLVAESWYSPKVKWFVKERAYEATGVVERELISFRAE